MSYLPQEIINQIRDFIPKDNQFESISGLHMNAIITCYSDYNCEYYESFPTYALNLNKYGVKLFV